MCSKIILEHPAGARARHMGKGGKGRSTFLGALAWEGHLACGLASSLGARVNKPRGGDCQEAGAGHQPPESRASGLLTHDGSVQLAGFHCALRSSQVPSENHVHSLGFTEQEIEDQKN